MQGATEEQDAYDRIYRLTFHLIFVKINVHKKARNQKSDPQTRSQEAEINIESAIKTINFNTNMMRPSLISSTAHKFLKLN